MTVAAYFGKETFVDMGKGMAIAERCATVVDWAATGTMLQGIGGIGGALAVIVAAVLAANTFNAWRRQRIEERRLVHAEAALTLAYKLERAIGSIRNPAHFGPELEGAEQTLRQQGVITDTTPRGQHQSLITGQVVLDRITAHSVLYDKLDELRPSIRAVFGSDAEAELATFQNETQKVRAAAVGYARTGREHYRNQQAWERDMERSERYGHVIWEDSEINAEGDLVEDRIKKAVAVAVAALETRFRPYFDANVKST